MEEKKNSTEINNEKITVSKAEYEKMKEAIDNGNKKMADLEADVKNIINENQALKIELTRLQSGILNLIKVIGG